jgi:hypothetical protein
LRYVCNAAADPSLADDARNTASCLKDGPLISAGSGTNYACATRSRGVSSRRLLACGSTPDSSTPKTMRMFGRTLAIATTATFSRHRMRLVFLFDQERRWRVERGAEARRAKSLTPGFNSNRLLGKASDGNGQARCKGKRGSGAKGTPTGPLLATQNRSTCRANTYPTPRSVWIICRALGSYSSLRRRRRICKSPVKDARG